MVNPELYAGESEVPSELRPAISKSSEYPSGKIRIEELLDTLSCFMCNAGLVVAIFSGLMMMIRHKEANVQMSRVPSYAALQAALIQGSLALVAGFLMIGSFGLFRKWKLWNDDRYMNFVRKSSIVIATILTAVLLVFHNVATFALSLSDEDVDKDKAENRTPPATLYPMSVAISMFLMLVIGISLKVMIFNRFGDEFVDDSTSPKFTKFADNEKTIPGLQ